MGVHRRNLVAYEPICGLLIIAQNVLYGQRHFERLIQLQTP